MPGLAGRFAAEWSPSGATSRRNSLQRVRGRTGGGVMVRKAILDRDELPVDEYRILPDELPAGDPGPQRGQPWRGAGGRWLVWTGRAVIWAVLLLVGYRGVLAIFHDETGSSAPS